MITETNTKRTLPDQAGADFAKQWLAGDEDRQINDLIMTLGTVHLDVVYWTDKENPFYNKFIPLNKPTCEEESRFLSGFMYELWEQYAIRREALRHRHYSIGMDAGKKWAREHATDEELDNIAYYLSTPYDCGLINGNDYEMSNLTVSHELLMSIRNDYIFRDLDGNERPLSDVYFEFWNRLLADPVNKDDFAQVVTPSHPLRSAFFVVGFADGALGISDQLT